MKTKKLVTTAMLIAIAMILSFVKILKLPFGGAITLVSMMPIVLVSYIYGIQWGLSSALVYSFLQLVTDGSTVSAFFMPGDSYMPLVNALLVCAIDYIFAFTMLGLGGIFKGKLKNDNLAICLGSIVALAMRYVMHIISGAIFFGAWAEWFFADKTGLMQIAVFKGFCSWVLSHMSGAGLMVFYSICYNGAYMIPEIIITAIITPIIYSVLKKSHAISE